MRDNERKDAWDKVFTLTPSECEGRGFCWATHEVPGIPWCYYKKLDREANAETCAAASNSRQECATPGKPIDEKLCTTKGCCWASGPKGQPWCFYPAKLTPDEDEKPTPVRPTPRFVKPTPPPPNFDLNSKREL